MHSDAEGAAAWAEQLSDVQTRDSLILELNDSPATKSPQRAVKLAATISDVKLQEKQVRRAVLAWANEDYAAAKKWLVETQQLADATKKALLKELN
jgi:hypothetical protein